MYVYSEHGIQDTRMCHQIFGDALSVFVAVLDSTGILSAGGTSSRPTTMRSQDLSSVLASLQKWVLTEQKCEITQLLSTKGLTKLLSDFTGTIFVQCENPVILNHFATNVSRW